MKCRHCENPLDIPLADLGSAPLSNGYLTQQTLHAPEKWYPLKVWVCSNCFLAQTHDYVGREDIFSQDYAYFSAYSSTWLTHCRHYCDEVVDRLSLSEASLVGEIACNDGSLLQCFNEKNIPCFGVEPTQKTAEAAIKNDITVFMEFFGETSAKNLLATGYASDLLIANNVLAHVPDINDFVRGFTRLLKPQGIATFEFPHLYRLITELQFDTIYHEHFSYLSLTTIKHIFEKNGLSLFDVCEIPTHGGSLRVFAQREDTGTFKIEPTVDALLLLEAKAGINNPVFYHSFQNSISSIKHKFLNFLLQAKQNKQTVVAYGAAAKGNTLLNFSGIREDLITYVVDRNPQKQNNFLPGSRIPIVAEQQLKKDDPAWIVILPWNIKDEITTQLSYARRWNAKFVTAIPTLTIF